jgi:hypothetical protein
MTAGAKSVLLSNVVVGRNDDYGGGYLDRLATSLNHLAENLRKEGRQDEVEVVFVDWGSDKPVGDVVKLTPDAAAIVQFVEVDGKIVSELSEPGSFYATLAVNVGVRRARGEYIMLADSDGLMRRRALSTLLSLLEGKLDPDFDPSHCILPIRRIQIPYDVVRRKPSLRRWDELLDSLQPGARTESPGTGCLGGFSAGQLMHRCLWYEFGGYNESLKRPWGWSDNELMLRVTQKYEWTDLVAYGVMAFHMEHGPRRRWWSASDLPKRNASNVNRMLVTSNTSPNGPDWGLANRSFRIRRASPSGEGNACDSPGEDVLPLLHKLSDKASIRTASTTPYVRDSIQRVLNHCSRTYGIHASESEEECLALLVSYVSTVSPLNFVHFGKLAEHLLFGILTEHTAIETYLIRPWDDGDSSEQRCHPGVLSQLLEHSMYRGYARIIGGDPIEALAGLRLNGGIEFALVHTSQRESHTPDIVESCVARLARGGAVVVYGPQESKEMERYDRVDSAEIRPASGSGRPYDTTRKPFSQSLWMHDLIRVVTIIPDCLTYLLRQPAVARS